MLISSAFPSKYVSAADLKGEARILTMANVDMEKIGDDTKPVLYFRGTEKGLALNKTNAKNIADIYGDDTQMWHGQQIVLFPTMTDYQGKTVDAIRVRQVMPKDQRQQRVADPVSSGSAPTRAPVADMPDDDIPF